MGDGDTIVKYLCSKLEQPAFDLSQVKLPNDPPILPTSSTTTEAEEDIASIVPERVAESHVYLFPGANGGRWVESIKAAFEESSDEEDAHTAGEGEGEGGSREGLLEVPETESRSRSRSEPASSDEEKEEGLSKKIRFH